MSRGPLLVIPACGSGLGGGHFVRCVKLVRELRTLGREAWLCAGSNADSFIAANDFEKAWIRTETGLSDISWECIILDRFQTPPEEFARWSLLAPVVGIDEGGPCRNHFDFLIDILPGTRNWGLGIGEKSNQKKPNIADTSLLSLPEKKEKPSPINGTAPLKILISFGQEDAAGLGPAAAKALTSKNSDNAEITLLLGKLQPHLPIPHSSPLIAHSQMLNLSEHLNEYGLIITHYGLTAFETLYAGVPVLLISPGAYHEKLAKAAGFCSLGIGKNKAKKLVRLLYKNDRLNTEFLDDLETRCSALAVKHNLDRQPRQSLAELINGFELNVSRNCSACGTVLRGPVLARFAERTYRRCICCGVISMSRLNPPPIEYGKDYFFDQYWKQYGKTYLEDFPNLIAMGKRRLAVIKSLLPVNDRNAGTAVLLDIGCAYGPFLAAAKEEGFSPFGIDPAEDAVRYVTQILGIPAVQGFFPEMGIRDWRLGTRKYDIVTLWYVIEHFRDCVPAFVEIRKLLKPGGVLALSTPSYSGISGRVSLRRFLKHSPADHWTIWSPAACKKALKTAGFTVKKIVITGHHPERFPLLGKLAGGKKSPLYLLLLSVSKILSLGDTFEVYAIGE